VTIRKAFKSAAVAVAFLGVFLGVIFTLNSFWPFEQGTLLALGIEAGIVAELLGLLVVQVLEDRRG
jgi:hypothetical protein